MSESQPVQRRRSPKRELLLDTAFRLFYEGGYHAVGIDKILAESGLAKMTLYHHFKSKDELIAAALDRRALQIRDLRSGALAAAGPEPLAKLSAIFDAYGHWFETPDFRGCAFIRAIGEYPDEDSPIKQLVKTEKQVLIDTFAAIAADLPAADPQALAQQLYLLAEGSIVRAHTFKDSSAAKTAKTAALALAQASIKNN